MGVKGLWKLLQPASSTESLTRLAMDGFHASLRDHAGYRVGIDVSIWFGHAEMLKDKSKLGENPELRTMFYRCTRLLELPILPLFVFDGPQRPKIKRGKMARFKGSRLVTGMKSIANAFGFHCHFAPGEAEAELAYLNIIGVIDAVWTDDVDTLLFGARTVIRNPSSTLSGNLSNPVLNPEGRHDEKHVHVYTAHRVQSGSHIQLTRNGLILIGLLHGGDYHKGVPGIGIALAHCLARCGFGETLAQAYETAQEEGKIQAARIDNWRTSVVEELRTDSLGILGKKYSKLAKSFPQDFPDSAVARAYLIPSVSQHKPQFDWHRQPDIKRLADFCETYFDWGYEQALLHRFRSRIWPGAVMRMLRHVVCEAPGTHEEASVASSSNRLQMTSPGLTDTSLVVRIHGRREDASTDGTPELRLEINPEILVELAKKGLSGQRTGPTDDASGKHSKPGTSEEPQAHLRVWMPASIVQLAVPQLVSEYIEHVGKHSKKRKRDVGTLATDGQGSSGIAASRIAEGTSSKSARASADQTSPCVHASDGSSGVRSMTDTARRAENKVIVISDSEDDEEHRAATKVAIDLTQ